MHTLPQPLLCIVCGVAGSGKTSLGTEVSKRLANSVFLPKDLIQGAFSTTERRGDTYNQISIPTLRILIGFADLQLSQGKIPIIDHPFSFNHRREDERKDWVALFKAVADKHKVRLAVIRCVPPSEEELKNRLQQRGNVYDRWKLNNWEKFMDNEPIEVIVKHHDVLQVVTDRPAEELAEQIILDYLTKNQ
ncbi:AAA family ATPase [Candidatus Woesearchaeota archaeon]|nr:AAA family ATPase [Candidatus Woesearchaeota archaeon]